MARKPIRYPLDYDNDPALKREHRGGVAWMLILSALIVALSIASMGLRARLMQTKAENIDPEALWDALREHGILMPWDNAQDGPHRNEWGGWSQDLQPVPHRPEEQKESEQRQIETPPAPTPGIDPTPVPVQSAPAETVEAQPTPTPALNPDFADKAAEPFTQTFDSLPDVIDAVAPGVVGVVNWQYYERTTRLVEWGSGSGFIITTDGYILTNQHVVEGAEKVTVKLKNGEQYTAAVIGGDKTSDIAVLKIDADNLTALPKGDSDALRVGQFVFAVGDPVQSELAGSVTFGIISSTLRSINIDGFTNDYLQTDAAINLGNSGGPLIDMNGSVVGMNSAKTVTAGYDDTGRAIAAEGIGFALPINRVWEIATQLITEGKVQKPGIGVKIAQTRPEMRDIVLDQGGEVRPYIDSVTEGGPAGLAGMQAGDVVLKVDGIEYDDYSDIVHYIQKKTKVGQEIVFTVERAGEQLELTVIVGDLNQMP